MRVLANVLVACGVLFAAVPAVHAQELPADPVEAVHLVLEERCPSWAKMPRLQERLLSIGPGALPELFEVWTARSVRLPSGERRPLGRMDAFAVAMALERLPRSLVLGHLERGGRGVFDVPRRVAGLRLLKRFARAEDLELLVLLGAPDERLEGSFFEQLNAFSETLGAVAHRDPAMPPSVAAGLRGFSPLLRDEAIRVLGSLGDEEALRLLAGLVGRDPSLDALLLLEIRTLVGAGVPVAQETLQQLRDELPYLDPASKELLAAVLAELGDVAAVPALIEMVESRQVGVAVHRALCVIARLNLPQDVEAWHAWHEAELAWWDRRSQGLLQVLAEGSATVVEEVLHELAKHRLFVDEFEDEVLRVLDRSEPKLVALACGVLGELRSDAATGPLARLLEHENLAVRRASREALEMITGVDADSDPLRWGRMLVREVGDAR